MYLGLYGEGRSVYLSEIQRELNVPESYLRKAMQTLVRGGLLRVVRGPKGGYQLAHAADRITLKQVVEITEGVNKPFQCLLEVQGRPGQPCCGIATTFSDAYEKMMDELARITIADTVRNAKKSGAAIATKKPVPS